MAPPYTDFIDPETIVKVSTALGNIATIFTLNITPKIFVAFVAFIEDLWLYQYHRRNTEYPSTVSFFLQEASFIGEIKISPDFMNIFDDLTD